MSTLFARPETACEKAVVNRFEEVARDAAERAARLLRSRYGQRHEITFKSEIDLVTVVDREAERLIVETLGRAFPDHGIVAEESPARTGSSEYRWYVDPLDGTTNFAHGYPQFAVSLALARGEDVVVGLVCDPLRDETFTAVRGEGAQLNGARIQVSDVPTLARSLLGSGFPYDHRERLDFYVGFWREALRRAQGVRRAGSAALDLCYVACGRFDGFWEWKLHAWDVAAGCLIVEEAGGCVSDFAGGPHRLTAGQTAASNGRVHDELVRMLTEVGAEHASAASPAA